jgi:hypothetical protein
MVPPVVAFIGNDTAKIATGGDPLLEEIERVEPQFPIVPVGAEEVPFPVHTAVGDDRRPFQFVITQQPHRWRYSIGVASLT